MTDAYNKFIQRFVCFLVLTFKISETGYSIAYMQQEALWIPLTLFIINFYMLQ